MVWRYGGEEVYELDCKSMKVDVHGACIVLALEAWVS